MPWRDTPFLAMPPFCNAKSPWPAQEQAMGFREWDAVFPISSLTGISLSFPLAAPSP